MAGSQSGQEFFDVRKIRRLVELMKEHDLSEIDLRQGETRIRLRRGGAEPVASHGLPSPVMSAASEAPKPPPVAALEAPAKEEHIAVITSPMIGTFYSSPDPDADPYVRVGDLVNAETTVCIVEAMKVFNEIQAEISGKVVAVLVENGEPVEFGRPLFKVDTRQ